MATPSVGLAASVSAMFNAKMVYDKAKDNFKLGMMVLAFAGRPKARITTLGEDDPAEAAVGATLPGPVPDGIMDDDLITVTSQPGVNMGDQLLAGLGPTSVAKGTVPELQPYVAAVLLNITVICKVRTCIYDSTTVMNMMLHATNGSCMYSMGLACKCSCML